MHGGGQVHIPGGQLSFLPNEPDCLKMGRLIGSKEGGKDGEINKSPDNNQTYQEDEYSTVTFEHFM
jgi:hypothetical protein